MRLLITQKLPHENERPKETKAYIYFMYTDGNYGLSIGFTVYMGALDGSFGVKCW